MAACLLDQIHQKKFRASAQTESSSSTTIRQPFTKYICASASHHLRFVWFELRKKALKIHRPIESEFSIGGSGGSSVQNSNESKYCCAHMRIANRVLRVRERANIDLVSIRIIAAHRTSAQPLLLLRVFYTQKKILWQSEIDFFDVFA